MIATPRSSLDRPSASERLLWVVLACLAWKYAVTFESAGVSREGPWPILIWVTTWAAGLGALVLGLSDRFHRWLSGWPIFGFFSSLFVAYGIVNVLARARDPYMFTTDAHTFMDYAARLLLDGKNPYEWSLSGAFAIHRMPTDLQTPLENGGLSDRLAYPSLSFLYLVPFVKLGIPTALAYAFALYGCLVVIFWVAPRELRPLVLLPFFVDQSYLAYAFGGVTDSVWALLLCLAVAFWKKRPALAALFVGLACSYKQHACLLAPFLVVRLWVETPAPERRRVLGRFVGIVAAVFVALNLPFLIWGPKEFALGMVEPLVAEMVPLGEGPAAFVEIAGACAPKPLFSAFFWGTYFGLLVVCAKWSRGRQLVWIAPSLAFFLNFRSLSSYWYFNLLPFVVDLAMTEPPETSEAASPRVRRLGLAYVGAIAAACVAVIVYTRKRHGEVEVVVHQPMRTWMSNVHRIDLRITNRGASTIHLRFWMQGQNFQPLPWKIDVGPHSLEPGKSGEFSISDVLRSSAFDIMRGGTLTIDDPNGAFRKAVVIPPDAAWGSPRAIPNARFAFWDVHAGVPTYWGLVQHGTPGAYTLPLSEHKTEGERHGVVLGVDTDPSRRDKEKLQLCLGVPTCWAANTSSIFYSPDDTKRPDHTVELVAELTGRSGKIGVWAKTPPDANAPPFTERYGVRVAFADKEVLALLGGDPAEGTLDDGTPYVVVPGPRDAWTRLEIDLDALRQKYAPYVYPMWNWIWRFPLLDIPVVPMKIMLEYTTRAAEPRRALFGEIDDPIKGKDDPDELYRDLMKHPAQIDVMRARYELELGNPTRGSRYLDRGASREQQPEIDLAGARLAAHHLDYEKAKRLFEKVEPLRPSEANVGIGWILMSERDPGHAAERFARAVKWLDEQRAARHGMTTGGEELDRESAMFGVALARAQMNDCDAMREALKDLPKKERDAKVDEEPTMKKCVADLASRGVTLD